VETQATAARRRRCPHRRLQCNNLKCTLIISLCLFIQFASAQTIKVFLDKKDILIGEQIKYNVNLQLPSKEYAINVIFPDSVPHFEIIDKNKTVINDNGNYIFRQTIVFTSFDSGAWHIPSFLVTIESPRKPPKKIFTDSVLINIGYSPADSSGQLRDIKPIMEVSIIDYFWYYIIGAVLLASIIFYLLYKYFKKKKKEAPQIYTSGSAYEDAIAELKTLKKYNLTVQADVKAYHTKLAEIFKNYYSRKFNVNVATKTTSDFLIQLKAGHADAEIISSTAESLRLADAVKFAKYFPDAAESERYTGVIKQNIEFLEKNPSQKSS